MQECQKTEMSFSVLVSDADLVVLKKPKPEHLLFCAALITP